MSSTLLVWNKVHPAVLSSDTQRQRFQPGEVVDVQPGEFDFGRDIARIGWWRVIVCDAPVNVTRGFLTGDLADPERPQAPRRLRVRRLNLAALGDRCTLDELLAAAIDVPAIVDPSVIGEPHQVIG